MVYLWIEDYKNIHKQGFNFSPRFSCDYDGQELTIKENDDHIKDFFGDNINVTAIVGKNGSGKSSLLELIDNGSYENPLINPFSISSFDLAQIIVYYNKRNNKVDIYIKNITISINNQSLISIEKITDKFIDRDETTDKFIQKVRISSSPSHREKEYLLLLLNFLINNSMKFPFDIPKFIYFGIHDEAFDLLELIKNEKIEFPTHYSPFELDKDKRFKIFHILLLLAYLKNYKIDFHIEISTNHDDTILELEEKIDKGFKEKIRNFMKIIQNNLEDFSKNPSHYINKKNLSNDFFKVYMDIIKRKNDKKLLDFKGKNVFSFNLYPKMSDGQYQLTYLFNMIYSQVNQKKVLLLIDECETFLHPNWQKKYLSYIIKFIKDNFPNRKIHIILTSHSPFLLSDIPKQNIIFLDKDENGNCKVVDGLKEKKQTFGANIHTLLSDSFFMEDGLMGEFAKGKIDKTIQLLNQDNLDEKDLKYCEQIISIVGEPIVKNQLQRMLDSKRLKKVDEIDAIKQSMEAMQKRLDELEK